jgi:hypothetical protein
MRRGTTRVRFVAWLFCIERVVRRHVEVILCSPRKWIVTKLSGSCGSVSSRSESSTIPLRFGLSAARSAERAAGQAAAIGRESVYRRAGTPSYAPAVSPTLARNRGTRCPNGRCLRIRDAAFVEISGVAALRGVTLIPRAWNWLAPQLVSWPLRDSGSAPTTSQQRLRRRRRPRAKPQYRQFHRA